MHNLEWLVEHSLRLLSEEGDEIGNVRIVEDDSNDAYSIYDIVSVFVAEDYRSQGYAEKLVRKALGFIAKRNGQVVSDCPYARYLLEEKLQRSDDIVSDDYLVYVTQEGKRFGVKFR